MKIWQQDNKQEAAVSEFFDNSGAKNRVMMGSARMEPGETSAWSAHTGDEYSYVLRGKLRCYAGEDEEHTVEAGNAIFTPAGQKHQSVNIGDTVCEVIWFEVAEK